MQSKFWYWVVTMLLFEIIYLDSCLNKKNKQMKALRSTIQSCWSISLLVSFFMSMSTIQTKLSIINNQHSCLISSVISCSVSIHELLLSITMIITLIMGFNSSWNSVNIWLIIASIKTIPPIVDFILCSVSSHIYHDTHYCHGLNQLQIQSFLYTVVVTIYQLNWLFKLYKSCLFGRICNMTGFRRFLM